MEYEDEKYILEETKFIGWFIANYSDECTDGEFWLHAVQRVIEKLEKANDTD